MQPVQICFHGLEASPALEELVRTRADQLARVDERINAMRVVIDAPHRHHHKGNHYRVCIELQRPGQDLVAGREGEPHVSDEDPYQAVRRAFDSLRRRLQAAQERQHGKQRARSFERGTIRSGR